MSAGSQNPKHQYMLFGRAIQENLIGHGTSETSFRSPDLELLQQLTLFNELSIDAQYGGPFLLGSRTQRDSNEAE